MPDDLLVQMEGITKDFPGVHALSDARFELRPGEVHALVGENGAGKSTLMKVLSGHLQAGRGQHPVPGPRGRDPEPEGRPGSGDQHDPPGADPDAPSDGGPEHLRGPRTARAACRFTLDDKRLERNASELIDRLHLRLDPRDKVKDLKVAQQQMVSIAQALSVDASVLIMDEPTAALTDTEIDELFRIIRSLREQGVGIVHISHRLEELRQISDRVTVMRDGRHVATVDTKAVTIARDHLDDGRAHHLRGGTRTSRSRPTVRSILEVRRTDPRADGPGRLLLAATW